VRGADSRTIAAHPGITFLSSGYMLVGASLINMETKAIVWRYGTQKSGYGTMVRHGPVLPFEDSWYVLPRDRTNPNTIVHFALPHDAAKQALAKIDPKELYDWAPGMKVTLNLSVVGDEKFRQSERERWVEGLKKMGFEVQTARRMFSTQVRSWFREVRFPTSWSAQTSRIPSRRTRTAGTCLLTSMVRKSGKR